MTQAQSDWARCRHWIEAALEYARGALTIEDVEAGLSEGRFHFWPGAKAAAVTEFIDYPRKRALNVFLVGGSREGMREIWPAIEEFGKLNSVNRYMAGGRKGFERVCEEFGFRPTWVVYVKDI